MSATRIIHRNIPQLIANGVNANVTVALWSRAVGKTEGLVSVRALHNARVMPRSVGAIVCDSYIHLKKEIIPEIIKSFENLGLVEGYHFWVNKRPPAGVPKAIRPMITYENVICMANGSAIKFYSTNTFANGDSIDWMCVEEARLIKYSQLTQMYKCLRGNREFFGDRPEHHGLLVVSDMPQNLESEWLFEFEKQVNPDRIEYILQLQQQINLRELKLLKWKAKGSSSYYDFKIGQIEKEILEFERVANEQRKKAVFVSYADSWDNAHVLGLGVLKGFRNTAASYEEYEISVLNKRLMAVDDNFYANFSIERHGYSMPMYEYLAKISNKKEVPDCRWDGDLDENEGLIIHLDYNNSISCMVVGQLRKDMTLDVLKVFWVEYPSKLEDLIKSFCEYYKYHKHKRVKYYYDHTATGEDANRNKDETHQVIVSKQIKENGWSLNAVKINSTTHKERNEALSTVFMETKEKELKVKFNTDNAMELYTACKKVKLVVKTLHKQNGQPYTKLEKDKINERSKKLKKIEMAHITEAFDGLVMGILQEKNNKNRHFIG